MFAEKPNDQILGEEDEEIKSYQEYKISQDDNTEDPLLFWKAKKHQWPRLYCLVEESLHSSIFNIIRKIFLNNGRIITKLRID